MILAVVAARAGKMARQLAMKGAAIPAMIHVLKAIEARNDLFFYMGASKNRGKTTKMHGL